MPILSKSFEFSTHLTAHECRAILESAYPKRKGWTRSGVMVEFIQAEPENRRIEFQLTQVAGGNAGAELKLDATLTDTKFEVSVQGDVYVPLQIVCFFMLPITLMSYLTLIFISNPLVGLPMLCIALIWVYGLWHTIHDRQKLIDRLQHKFQKSKIKRHT